MPRTLHTARLRLSPLTRDYLDALVELDSDPLVMRYISSGAPTPRERYESELLDRMCGYDDVAYGFFAAHEGAPFVGWFHLRPSVAEPSILELGYRLRRSAWGRGLATEGALALLRLAFVDLAQDTVDACADPRNTASIGVMKKCGMEYAGTFMHPRADIEVVRYLIGRARFEALQQRSSDP